MNERIKQLAEQAHKYAANDPRANITVSYVSIFEEKFAELVRQDEREACAKAMQPMLRDMISRSQAAEIIRGRTE
jgi:hypothetical protein